MRFIFQRSLNRDKSKKISCKTIRKKYGYIYNVGWGECIEDYIKMILSPSRHSLCKQRECLPDKIKIVSNTFRWNEECDLLSIENKSTLKFTAPSQLFIRYSAIEDPYVFQRLSVRPPIKLCIFVGTCLILASSLWLVLPM